MPDITCQSSKFYIPAERGHLIETNEMNFSTIKCDVSLYNTERSKEAER